MNQILSLVFHNYNSEFWISYSHTKLKITYNDRQLQKYDKVIEHIGVDKLLLFVKIKSFKMYIRF